MNKTVFARARACAIACLGGIAASSAMAQSSVAVYGVLDSGVVYTTNSNAAGDAVVKVPSLTGSVPSRLGFRGTEDLGGGLQAVFVLENGIGVDTGTAGQGGRLFGRQAYVGLKGAYGTLMLGRQINMTFLASVKSDVLGPNLFSMSSIDPYIPNARSDNAIGYLGAFSDFTVGATYSFGRDASAAGGPAATGCPGEAAGNAKACRQVTGLLGYDNKRYGLTATYDIMYGNTGAAAGLSTSDSSDRRATLNGYAMAGELRLGAGLMARKKVAATRANDLESDLYYLGASYPLMPALTLDGQVARHDVKASANDSTLAVLRLTYSLSKRTAVYSSIGRMRNGGLAAISLDAGGTVGAGLNQSGLSAGVRHAF
ncbi:porin [Pseudoduganella namucuonensis]|uniref:Outer membrane protein (Porin) n=1 Tax=Pseudoduganella namucuonensis TaxID=1035707 RepID=A0A1I7LNJ0_9BURK|nr:porin [Pseudoduganella namucuonensis]SFV11234.1 Outer membrane protein (porin) [Pseudoduganella namucuonensis]